MAHKKLRCFFLSILVIFEWCILQQKILGILHFNLNGPQSSDYCSWLKVRNWLISLEMKSSKKCFYTLVYFQNKRIWSFKMTLAFTLICFQCSQLSQAFDSDRFCVEVQLHSIQKFFLAVELTNQIRNIRSVSTIDLKSEQLLLLYLLHFI